MRIQTLRKLKKIFPSLRNESVADYFERLYKHLEEFNEYNLNEIMYKLR